MSIVVLVLAFLAFACQCDKVQVASKQVRAHPVVKFHGTQQVHDAPNGLGDDGPTWDPTKLKALAALLLIQTLHAGVRQPQSSPHSHATQRRHCNGVRSVKMAAKSEPGVVTKLANPTFYQGKVVPTRFQQGKVVPTRKGRDMIELLDGIPEGPEREVKKKSMKGLLELIDKSAVAPPEEVKMPANFAKGIIEMIASTETSLEGSGAQQELMSIGIAMDIVKVNIGNILQKEPNWDMFTKSLKVSDHTGAHLVGLSSNKFVLQTLQTMYKWYGLGGKVFVEDEHDIIVARGTDSASDPVLVVSGGEIEVQCQVQFGEKPIWFWQKSEPLDVEVDLVFHVTDEKLVDHVRITKWLVNGRQFQLWPNAKCTDSPDTLFAKLKEFAAQSVVSKELQRFRQSIKDRSSSGPAQLIGQQAPDLAVKLVNGQTRYLSGLIAEGKPLVIDFYMNF
jgi:hypothetical protein